LVSYSSAMNIHHFTGKVSIRTQSYKYVSEQFLLPAESLCLWLHQNWSNCHEHQNQNINVKCLAVSNNLWKTKNKRDKRVKLFLCTLGENICQVEVQIHSLLTLAPDRLQWSTSRLNYSIPGKRNPGTHWTGGRVGPMASRPFLIREKSVAMPGTEPQTSRPQPIHYTK